MNRADRRAAGRPGGRLVAVEVCLSGGCCCGLPTPDDLPADVAAMLGLMGSGAAGGEARDPLGWRSPARHTRTGSTSTAR